MKKLLLMALFATGSMVIMGENEPPLISTSYSPCYLSDSVAIVNATPPNCNNGSATIYVYGGSGVYTYSWVGGNSNTANNLSPGTYYYYIMDNNNPGCYTTGSFVISCGTTSCNLTASVSITNATPPNCNNGGATIIANGGSGVYTYSWVGGYSNTANNLSPGTYYYTVFDSNNCSTSGSFVISCGTTSCNLTASVSITNATLPNCNNGSATINAYGGSGVYTYSWAGGWNSNTAYNLSPGTYYYTVIDDSIPGCSTSGSFVITCDSTSCNLIASVGIFNATPPNCNNGSATIIANGGSGVYTYSWVGGWNSNTAINLSPGTYYYTVIDDSIPGCSTSGSFVITCGSTTCNLTANVSITNATPPNCNNGSATINAFGGSGVYTYSWIAYNSNTANNLSPGIYYYTVFDSVLGYGCSTSGSFVISCNTTTCNLTASVSITNATPPNCNNGSATIIASGGTGVYTYSWVGGWNSNTANNLSPGTYYYMVFDDSIPGCITSGSFVITCDSTTGIINLNYSNEIIIYPNPTKDIVNIESQKLNIKSIRIMDLSGRIIIEKDSINKDNVQVQLFEISKGMYFIEVNFENTNRKYKIIKE